MTLKSIFTSLYLATLTHPNAFVHADQLGWAGQPLTPEQAMELETMSPRDRILATVKTLWPECQNQNAKWCESLINNELAQMTFPGAEFVKSVIIYDRVPESVTYNAIVIQLDDNDLCVGRDDDGMLYYDWDWCGIGETLTNPAEISASGAFIKPSIYTNSIDIDPNVVCADGVQVNGNLDVSDIGGDFDPNSCSTADGYSFYQDVMNQSVDIAPAGCRYIGPFNCAGMTCMDACETVKHLVPDANEDRKQIECWCSYKSGTVKLVESQTETKVRIYASYASQLVKGTPELKEGVLGPSLPQ